MQAKPNAVVLLTQAIEVEVLLFQRVSFSFFSNVAGLKFPYHHNTHPLVTPMLVGGIGSLASLSLN